MTTRVEVITKEPLDTASLAVGPGYDVHVTRIDEASATPQLPAAALRSIMQGGPSVLPLTLVDGRIVEQGKLPTASQIQEHDKPSGAGPQFTAVDNYVEDSSVTFPTRSRVHMNLIVKDVARSVRFYQTFLGVAPTKNTGDYAKFELHDPPINLALMVDPHGGANPHFGIQVKSTQVIDEAVARYDAAGFHTYAEDGAACCYAKQEKTWLVDPDGNQWEVFVTTDTDAQEGCAPDCICYQQLEPSGLN